MVEQRFKIGKGLASKFSLRVETLRAGLAAAGCVLERPSRRGTFISETELDKFVAWSRARAGAVARTA